MKINLIINLSNTIIKMNINYKNDLSIKLRNEYEHIINLYIIIIRIRYKY